MKRIDEVMTREQRRQLADRVEVLEKVKALFLIPKLCMATTEQVADYFGVPTETIKSTVMRNREELEANGSVVLTPQKIDSLKIQNESSVVAQGYRVVTIENESFAVNNRGARFYPPRAILCLAMMLRDSPVAAEIRTQLLNLAEAAPDELKVANVQAQEAAMLDFARAMMKGDSVAIAQSVSNLIALKDHTIAALAASITKLSEEKTMLAEKTHGLEQENAGLAHRNESLTVSNRMLAEEAVTWSPRRATNAIIRKVASAIFNGRYGQAWNEFYRELMYQTGISVGMRGAMKNETGLDSIREDEWPQVMRVVAAIAYRYCIDVVDVTNEKVVEAYQLDRVETESGIRYNKGIVHTSAMVCA